MQLLQTKARVFVYCGEPVASCPRPCGNVEFVYLPVHPGGPRQVPMPMFHCSYCQLNAELEWPQTPDLSEILSVLMLRPVPHNRNWYPRDHDDAVRFNIPHGQSVQQLRDENAEHGIES